MFPASSQLTEASISGSPNVFKWAERMIQNLGHDGLEITKHFSGFNLCTEFSGSGCPEAALTSVVNTADSGMNVRCQYSADIDASCRKVLAASRQPLSCVNWLKPKKHTTDS